MKELTGYFIKDIRQFGELCEDIARLESFACDLESEKINKLIEEKEEYLIELVKRYH